MTARLYLIFFFFLAVPWESDTHPSFGNTARELDSILFPKAGNILLKNLWLAHFEFSSTILIFAKKIRYFILIYSLDSSFSTRTKPPICYLLQPSPVDIFLGCGTSGFKSRVQFKLGFSYFSECPAPSGVGCNNTEALTLAFPFEWLKWRVVAQWAETFPFH